jgi:hypothetical protein
LSCGEVFDVYQGGVIDETAIPTRPEAMRPRLDERPAVGIACNTMHRGLKALALNPAPWKVRRSRGGRPALTQTDRTLLANLRGLTEARRA